MTFRNGYFCQCQTIYHAKIHYQPKNYFPSIQNTRFTASPVLEVLDAPYCIYRKMNFLATNSNFGSLRACSLDFKPNFPIKITYFEVSNCRFHTKKTNKTVCVFNGLGSMWLKIPNACLFLVFLMSSSVIKQTVADRLVSWR